MTSGIIFLLNACPRRERRPGVLIPEFPRGLKISKNASIIADNGAALMLTILVGFLISAANGVDRRARITRFFAGASQTAQKKR